MGYMKYKYVLVLKQYRFLNADNTIFAMFLCVPLPAEDEQTQGLWGLGGHDDPRGAVVAAAAEGELLC